MEPSTLRLLLRLSLAVVVLLCTVLALVLGADVPLSRGGRGLPGLALLGSVVAITFVTLSLSARRHPGAPAAPTPLALGRRAIQAARERARSARARAAAARHRRRRAARVREAELAAIEAAGVDDDLAPARIRTAAEALVRLVYLAWDARDSKRLATLLGPGLLREWERALDDNDAAGEHHRAHVLGDVQIDLVGLLKDATGATLTIVLVEVELSVSVSVSGLYGRRHAHDSDASHVRRLCQYWTLTQSDPVTVQAIEEQAIGDHHLSEPIVAGAAG